MKVSISATSRMLILSIAFSMILLLVRFYYSHTADYRFYGWNTFLAVIPYICSTQLLHSKKMNWVAVLFLCGWLAFFPNAPYMITDLFHYEERPEVPYWYDLLLVVSAALNGLMLGLISLMNVEIFLARHLKHAWVNVCVFVSLLLCGYGVFIGRFLRFNSWNVLTDPRYLVYTSAHHVLLPQNYPKLWVFTVLFATLIGIFYFLLKKLPQAINRK